MESGRVLVQMHKYEVVNASISKRLGQAIQQVARYMLINQSSRPVSNGWSVSVRVRQIITSSVTTLDTTKDKTMKVISIVYVILNVLDIILTTIGITGGYGVEGNRMLAWFMSQFGLVTGLIIGKICIGSIIGFGSWLVYQVYPERVKVVLLSGCVLVTVAVMLWVVKIGVV